MGHNATGSSQGVSRSSGASRAGRGANEGQRDLSQTVSHCHHVLRPVPPATRRRGSASPSEGATQSAPAARASFTACHLDASRASSVVEVRLTRHSVEPRPGSGVTRTRRRLRPQRLGPLAPGQFRASADQVVLPLRHHSHSVERRIRGRLTSAMGSPPAMTAAASGQPRLHDRRPHQEPSGAVVGRGGHRRVPGSDLES